MERNKRVAVQEELVKMEGLVN